MSSVWGVSWVDYLGVSPILKYMLPCGSIIGGGAGSTCGVSTLRDGVGGLLFCEIVFGGVRSCGVVSMLKIAVICFSSDI